MRTKSHWKHLLIGLFFIILVFMVTVGIASCKKNTGEDSSNVDEPITGDEAGIYYFDADDAEYLISLNGNNFTLSISDEAMYGEYTFDGTNLQLTFDGEGGGTATATLSGDVLTLTYKDSTYRFLKRVFYKVTYEVDGGSAIEPSSVMNGKMPEKPADPKKDGYNFIGWYADGDFSEPFDFSRPITENITLYARFEKAVPGQDEFEVKFVSGTEGETFENQKTIGGVAYDLPTPSKEGFLGWWISDFEDASKLTCKYEGQKLAQNTTLYAVYESDAPAVSVNAQGISWTAEGTNNNYQLKVTLPDGTQDDTVPESTGTTAFAYDFASKDAGEYKVEVSLNGNTTTVYYKNKALARVSLFQVAEPSVLVFNPVENAEKYIITVDCGNKEHNHAEFDNGNSTNFNFANCEMQEGGITFTVRAMASGYMYSQSETFVYSRDLEGATGLAVDAELEEVVWNKVDNATSYVVEIVSGEESYKIDVGNATRYSLKEYKGELTIKVTPVAEGYNSPEAAAITYNKTSLPTPGNIRVAEGRLIWDAVDGAESYNIRIGATTYQVAPEDAAEVEFPLSGEYFNGALAEISVQAVGASEEETSLYSDPIAVSYDTMSDTLSYGNGEVSWKYVVGAARYGITVNGGSETIVEAGSNKAAVTLTREGANEIVVCYYDDAGNRSQEAKITVYAYSVTFDVRGGTEVETLYKAIGDPMTLPTSAQEGYDFGGWYNVPGGPKSNGAEYTDKVFRESGDIVLYAYWKPKAYTVTFDLAGGSMEEQTITVYYNQPYQLPVPTTQDGTKGFVGWFTDRDGNGIQCTDENGVSLNVWKNTKDTTLYACWADALSYEYDQSTDGYAVTQGRGLKSLTSVTIPAQHEGKPVTIVDGGAFKNCVNLVEINIPNTITRIEMPVDASGAGSPFENCSKLQNVNIYEVEGTHEKKYESVDGVLIALDSDGEEVQGRTLTYFPEGRSGAYAIPDGITTLRINVFKDADITEITIPASVAQIEQNAFRSSSVEKVTFLPSDNEESEVELSLAENVFQSCSSLTEINFPARLKELPLSCFTGCSKLTTINVEEDGEYYSAKDGLLCNAAGTQILFCPKGISGEFTIPSGIQSIGEGAFESCKKISTLIVPGYVTEICEGAFRGCTGLDEIQFEGQYGEPALSIGEYAFYQCTGLREITLPGNLASLGQYAFGGIEKLKTVRVDSGLGMTLENGAFMAENGKSYVTTLFLGPNVPVIDIAGVFGALDLETVEVDPNNPNYSSDKDGVLFNKDQTRIVYYPTAREGDYKIPDTVIEIGAGVFQSKSGLTEITIGKNVTSIGDKAFMDCANLSTVIFEEGGTEPLTIGASAFENIPVSSIVLPERVVSVGAQAFRFTDVTEFVFPEGVTEIGDKALAACHSLTSVTIPASVERMGLYDGDTLTSIDLFEADEALEEIIVADDNAYFASKDGILYGKTDGKLTDLYVCPRAKSGEVVIPGSVARIWPKAFFSNTGLTKVTFEKSETSLEILEGDTKDSEGLFASCTALREVVFPNGLTTISRGMFWGCAALEKVFIPNTVTSIKSLAFYNCKNLATLTFEEGGTASLEIEDGTRTDESGSAHVSYSSPFSGTESLENLVLPERTTVIGNYVFAAHKALKNITIPATLQRIGDGAFTDCKTLTSISFPENSALTTIGKNAFQKSGLTSVNLPSGLTELGAYAFSETAIEQIVIPAGVKTLGEGVFFKILSLKTVTFAENGSLEAIEKNVFAGCSALTEIVIPATVKTIGETAFQSCEALTRIEFQEGSQIASIGNLAFSYTGISSFSFPESSSDIELGMQLFAGIELEEVYLSNSVTNIDKIFDGCLSVGEITIAEGHENFWLDGENPIIYNKDKTSMLYIYGEIEGEFAIPEGMIDIGESAFNGQTKITGLVLPSSLQKIGDSAFKGCTALKTVRFEGNSNLLTINANAFSGCTSLESIAVPDGVTEIGNSAFNGCTSLTSVSVPGSVTTIGSSVFKGDTSLNSVSLASGLVTLGKNMFQDCTALETIKLPSNADIPEYIFDGCTQLVAVTLPVSFQSIGNYAFQDCALLAWGEGLALPKELISIGSGAFSNNAALTKVTFPTHLESIGSNAFKNTGLTEVFIPNSVKDFGTRSTTNEYTVSTSVSVFSGCVNLTKVTFEEGSTLEAIAGSAFLDCEKLSEIILPSNLELIGNSAFKNTALTTFTVPVSVTKLGTNIFEGCLALTSVTFEDTEDVPSELETLGNEMFLDCSNLTTVKLPSSLIFMGKATFQNSGLTEIEIPGGVTALSSSATASYSGESALFDGCRDLHTVTFAQNKDGEYSLTAIGGKTFQGCVSLKTIDLPSSLTGIGQYAFSGSGLTAIKIPAAVEDFSNYIFMDCGDLASVEFEKDKDGETLIDTISISMFKNCTSLTSFVVPDSVTFINDLAFENTGLVELTIGEKVDEFGDNPFGGCKALTKITVDEKNETFSVTDEGALVQGDTLICYPAGLSGTEGKLDLSKSGIETLGVKAFYGCDKLTEIVLPETLIKINDSAFENCTKLTSIAIPDSVTTIGSSAGLVFAGCTSLTEIAFGENSGLTEIKKAAFSNILSVETLVLPASLTKIGANAFENSGFIEVTISGKLTSVGNYMFRNCRALETVTWAEGTTTTGQNTFQGCINLTTVNLPSTLTKIDAYAFDYFEDDNDEIFGCTSLKQITIPESVTTIGKYAFRGSGLTSIEIPAGVTSLGANAFAQCASLTSVEFEDTETNPAKLTKLSGSTFKECTALKEVRLPESLTELGASEFNGCTALESITLPDSVKKLGTSVFEACTSLINVTLPASLAEISISAFEGCTALASLTIPEGVTKIGNNAFSGTALTELTIPDSVTTIGKFVFENCVSMPSIFIPKTVTTLDVNVFAGWTETQTVYIEFTEEEVEELVKNGDWKTNWAYDCNAEIVYGATEDALPKN